MNGAESLVRTMVGAGVDVCFTNPGTSEMHFVAALDKVDGMRCVLGLFEGGVTGMADGFARMADKPASTLLHLGPGLANGLANLHNARRAMTPIVNIVGDHTTYHHKYDAPLTADITKYAAPVSHWIKQSRSSKEVAQHGAEAIQAAQTSPGQIATLILPGDTAWEDAEAPAAALPAPARAGVDADRVVEAARLLKSGEETVIMMTGPMLREGPLETIGKVQAATGCRLFCMGANGRWERGAGRVDVERTMFVVDVALKQFATAKNIILLGAKAPVAFFGYPGKPSALYPEGCNIHTLATVEEDAVAAAEALAAELDCLHLAPLLKEAEAPAAMSGPITPESLGRGLAAFMPENAIVVDESVTTGRAFMPFTAGAPKHDWLSSCGGSIGFGIPAATGAAIACPDRKVICLEGDGSGMYTLQALWTQARENCNVVNIIFANRTYEILKGELMRVGADNPGRKAIDMLEIGRPDLDWVAMSQGMGVPATRAFTSEEFNEQLARAVASEGPSLIEVVVP
ncbi:MAG: acetolactate synthase large subunit [Pseudomonadota bacterium]|nr:acetolactate synthase large subunit [Pseudomonadota bacterium]